MPKKKLCRYCPPFDDIYDLTAPLPEEQRASRGYRGRRKSVRLNRSDRGGPRPR